MPRGRKKLGTIDEQIEQVTEKLKAAEAEVSDYKRKLKELELKKREDDNKALMDAIQKSGKSTEEIIELING